jgi:hypothetical protein
MMMILRLCISSVVYHDSTAYVPGVGLDVPPLYCDEGMAIMEPNDAAEIETRWMWISCT